jgi:diphosphomevalonate decarboxylase
MSNNTNQFLFTSSEKVSGSIFSKWESPSNIALIKYWGKKENQIPANPSISFTLSNCKTITSLTAKKANKCTFEVWTEGSRKESFEPKIAVFLDRIKEFCPYLDKLHLHIETTNTFPHSSGIASSASGLSALSLCIMDIEKQLNPALTDDRFFRKASFLARLGSGSAARSLYPGIVSWGENQVYDNSSNLYATAFNDIHPIFNDYQDSILLIDEGEKTVSSTVGHNLMHNHPFANKRFEQAHDNMEELKGILKKGNNSRFIEIVESEALTLHAMMMCSNPYFILMKPNTLKAIELIWAYRKKNNSKICFTLDAGANVHILYPKEEKITVQDFILAHLAPLCQNGKVIHDMVGKGPNKLG